MTWGAGTGIFTDYNVDLEIPGPPSQVVNSVIVQASDPRLATFDNLTPGQLYQASVTTLGTSTVVGRDRRFRTSKICQCFLYVHG